MSKRGQPRTLLDYAIAHAGMRGGTRIGVFVAQWVIAQRALGHEPTVEEAAAWWKESQRSWYRRLSEFREVFPDQENPAAIARGVIEQLDRNKRPVSKREVGLVLGLLGSIEHGVSYGGVVR